MNALPAINVTPEPLTAVDTAPLFAGLASEQALLVAVSGGPDSVALLALMAEWAASPGRPKLFAATVDHGLRADSAVEARAVGLLCDALDVPHVSLSWEGSKPSTGIQAKAREARYALLTQEAQRLGGAVIVTAHTRDDQAETLMMRMARGSGPSGLAGMRARTQRGESVLARPLLGVEKARLIATCVARGLSFFEDPSNGSSRFERVRWRKLMPVLASAGLDAGRLEVLAQRAARMEDALSELAGRHWAQLVLEAPDAERVKLRFRDLLGEPDEIALRVLARALAHLDSDRIMRLERLETCLSSLRHAAREGAALTRTLSGCMLMLGRDGVLTIRREPQRKRGVHPAIS